MSRSAAPLLRRSAVPLRSSFTVAEQHELAQSASQNHVTRPWHDQITITH
jgi:hypothetical protein